MNDFRSLPGIFEIVWSYLEDAVEDAEAPARVLGLATVGLSGGAEARMVILRGADRARGDVLIYTNAASSKHAEIEATPAATLLIWDPAQMVQIRLRSQISLEPGGSAALSRLSRAHQALYSADPRPGTTLDAPCPPGDPDPALFTVLRAHVTEIEVLHLGRDLHRRALFTRESGFTGQWIAP